MPFYRKLPGVARILVLLMIGAIIFGAMLFVVKRGQKTVLLYLSHPGTIQETIMKSSLSNSPEVFLSDFGYLQEMQPSPDGEWLAILISPSDGMMQVQLYDLRSGVLKYSYDCGELQCSMLEWKADAGQVFFRIHGNGENSRMMTLSVKEGQVNQISLNEKYDPLYFSLSPDEQYQVLYDDNAKGFYLLDNWNKELVLMKSEDASAVVWVDDPVRVLMVATEHEEKIPVSHIAEITPATLKIRYLKDSEITYMDFNNLTLRPNSDDLVFGCRPVLRTTSRQLCVSNLEEFVGMELTNIQSKNHAGAVFDSTGTWLAYQTFELESSTAVPTIWVMNWETGSTIPVEENATMPRWVP
jgi:hypothetical protein